MWCVVASGGGGGARRERPTECDGWLPSAEPPACSELISAFRCLAMTGALGWTWYVASAGWCSYGRRLVPTGALCAVLAGGARLLVLLKRPHRGGGAIEQWRGAPRHRAVYAIAFTCLYHGVPATCGGHQLVLVRVLVA